MKITSIKPVGREPVYNLEVAQTHSFAIENGVVVHNCADEVRYFCMGRPIKTRIIGINQPHIYNPLATESKPNTYGLGVYLNG